MCNILVVIGRMSVVWHKSARMGEILNPCHNFEIFITLVFLEWSACRDHLAIPGVPTSGNGLRI